ncbi:MAG: zinc ribbon domain-containing protein [Bacillota bacterium]|nr:zinc ribbon domain-containing protein [Bacillota bacterium]
MRGGAVLPLYEFYCSDCGKKTEELCSSTVNKIKCPTCGREAGRVMSAFRTGKSSTGGGTASSNCGG